MFLIWFQILNLGNLFCILENLYNIDFYILLKYEFKSSKQNLNFIKIVNPIYPGEIDQIALVTFHE